MLSLLKAFATPEVVNDFVLDSKHVYVQCQPHEHYIYFEPHHTVPDPYAHDTEV